MGVFTIVRSSRSRTARRKPRPVTLWTTPASRFISTNFATEDQTLVLPDNRVLGYAEFGNPKGYPLMFFHGLQSSRLEAKRILKATHRHDLRIISPDRPGYGLSTFYRDRNIMDWPSDVQALAGHLGLSRFAILGGSGGGPYALACAHTLPRETLSSVGILSAAPPWEAGKNHLGYPARALHLAVKYCPSTTTAAMNAAVKSLRWGAGTSQGVLLVDKALLKLEQGEESKRPIEERRNEWLRIRFEGFRQGAKSTVQELGLLSQSWGFRFEDVTYDKIRLWHGKNDAIVPVRMIRYLAEHLPHAELREFDGCNHFTVYRHLKDFLSILVPEREELSQNDLRCLEAVARLGKRD